MKKTTTKHKKNIKKRTNVLLVITLLVLSFSPLSAVSQNWNQMGLDIDGEAAGDFSGQKVSLSSDGYTVAIGAYGNENNTGHVRVYEWNGTNWNQKGLDINGEALDDESGRSMSLDSSGNVLAIGGYRNNDHAGHVRVYQWDGTNWQQKGVDIDGQADNILGFSAGDDLLGYTVSLNANGDILAASAPNNGPGHVKIYEWNGTNWAQKGVDINGEGIDDIAGFSLDLSSNGLTVAIGALMNNNGNGTDAGHVKIYEWNGSNWLQKGTNINGEAAGDWLGRSVALSSDGLTVVIGADGNAGNGNGTDDGHVKIYEWDGFNWLQKGTNINGEGTGDNSGNSVDISSDGNTVAIGAVRNDGNGNNNSNAGHVRLYKWNGTNWLQKGADIDGETASDWSGAVALSSDGNRVAIGAYLNDGNGNNNTSAGHVRIYRTCGINTVTQDNTLLTSDEDEPGTTYRWVNCPGMTTIIGATSQSYNATANGDYAVIVTNGCSDTSACYTVEGVGITETSFGDGFLIYPNPTNGDFSIDLGDNYQSITVTLTDLNGRLIESKVYDNSQLLNLTLEEPSGIYLLKIESKDKRAFIRLVKNNK